MAEQRYQAVLAVISDGESVTDVAARFGVSRRTVHDWLAKYEAGGLENLGDTRGACVFKSDSVNTVRDVVEGATSAISSNEFFALNEETPWACPCRASR